MSHVSGVDLQMQKVAMTEVAAFVYYVECRWRDRCLRFVGDGGQVPGAVVGVVRVREERRYDDRYEQRVYMSNRNLQFFVLLCPAYAGNILPDTKI